MNWIPLGAVSPTELVDARLQLHHAAQIVASAGTTFLEPRADDSHPNLGWSDSLGALLSHALPGAGSQVGLRVSDISLLFVDDGGSVIDEYPLLGKTLEDGFAWLASTTARIEMPPPRTRVTRADYAIPDHAVHNGSPFSSSTDAFVEFAHWFANGHNALGGLAARSLAASEVRCWPHHFDLGSLEVVDTHSDGSLAKSIGMGFSPGDDGYAEPYWYISPWPYPEPNALPELSSGHWHTTGHTSAILTGSDLIAGSQESQYDRLRSFLDAAVDAGRRALAS